VALRWVSRLSALLRERPEGWFSDGWEAETAAALAAAVARLEAEHGADPAGWAWGTVRPLTLRHPLGDRRPLARIFNRGPIAYGGDANTPAQASNAPHDPTADPLYTGTLRMSVDVGAWEAARWVLASGQSGNPLSPHYDDQFGPWRRGEGIPIPWDRDAVRAAAREVLELEPA
jgi:penicillin amidase